MEDELEQKYVMMEVRLILSTVKLIAQEVRLGLLVQEEISSHQVFAILNAVI